jgi:hypothetical protein
MEIERGNMDASFKLLSRIADALNTTVGRIADNDPRDTDFGLVDAVSALPKERRGQALEIIKTFKPYQRIR